MKYYYDLHIHSALSPCADDDMTPNNIVNMALIKGLQIIALTDHNSTKNCRPCLSVAEGTGLLVIPGMELQTKEDIHVVCLFQELESAEQFEENIDAFRLMLPNKPAKFGHQLVYNDEDEVVSEYKTALITSIDLSMNQVMEMVSGLGGVAVPAHLDRQSFSILSNLGFIPPDLKVTTVEVSRYMTQDDFLVKHPYMKDFRLITNSDAHNLGDIMEPQFEMELESLTSSCVIQYLKHEVMK